MDLVVRWSPEAAEDLESILEYIARDSVFYARAVAWKILDISCAIPGQPFIGRVVPEIGDMMVYLDLRVREKNPATADELSEAVQEGALMRIRPVLMTVITAFAGLLPIFIFDGLGADVMRRIALPMVGGMITTVILILVVIPVIYCLWEGRRFERPA